jgi:hypothetical protein
LSPKSTGFFSSFQVLTVDRPQKKSRHSSGKKMAFSGIKKLCLKDGNGVCSEEYEKECCSEELADFIISLSPLADLQPGIFKRKDHP